MQRLRLWIFSTLLFMVGIGLGPFAGGLAAQKDVLVAKKTASPPTLDGTMEDMWKEAQPLTVKVLGGRNFPCSPKTFHKGLTRPWPGAGSPHPIFGGTRNRQRAAPWYESCLLLRSESGCVYGREVTGHSG